MAKRGGYRPGAGRPKGSLGRTGREMATVILPVAEISPGQTPLEYMLAVMRNPDIDPSRRDRMAIAAAPFCHARISDNRVGKRDAAAEQAKVAGVGSDWSADLAFAEAH